VCFFIVMKTWKNLFYLFVFLLRYLCGGIFEFSRTVPSEYFIKAETNSLQMEIDNLATSLLASTLI